MVNATLSTDEQAMGRLTTDDVSVARSIPIYIFVDLLY